MTKTPRPAWIGQTLNSAERNVIRDCVLAAIGVVLITVTACSMAQSAPVTCDQRGCSDWQGAAVQKQRRISQSIDANGNALQVRSKSGVAIKVAPSARAALQCVVDYVEAHGVKIKYMRGYGGGTVRGSLHPSGRAIDINQLSRNVTRPVVPRAVSNGAADHCGVVSGARWGYADNGHWNLMQTGRPNEPWPRVLNKGETDND